jgi:hypothetical protein
MWTRTFLNPRVFFLFGMWGMEIVAHSSHLAMLDLDVPVSRSNPTWTSEFSDVTDHCHICTPVSGWSHITTLRKCRPQEQKAAGRFHLLYRL